MMVSESLARFSGGSAAPDERDSWHQVVAEVVRRDLRTRPLIAAQISEFTLLRLPGSYGAPRLAGLDRVALALAERRDSDDMELDDVRSAIWILADVALRGWLSGYLGSTWANLPALSPREVSGLRAHAVGLPLWTRVPAWWRSLESGAGAATSLSGRRAVLILAAPEMTEVGVSVFRPASPFVHLEELAAGYASGGLQGWIRLALESLALPPSGGDLSPEILRPFFDAIARSAADRWEAEDQRDVGSSLGELGF